MKIIFFIKIVTPSDKEGITFSKEFDSKIIPFIGAHISDPIFVEPKLVEHVTLNYSEDTCFVVLQSKEVVDGNLDGHVQEVAELHSWKEKK